MCDALAAAKYIDRPDFMRLYEKMADFAFTRRSDVPEESFAKKVESLLDEMGYELLAESPGQEDTDIPPAPGEVRYLSAPFGGYLVMLKTDSGEAAMRLVREESASGSGDREAGEKWCRDFDAFLEKMESAGLPMDVSLRVEPGEAEIMKVPAQKHRERRKGRGKSRERESAREYGGPDA
jgi:hypothetical protein